MQAHSNNTSKDFKDFLEVVKKMEAQSKGWARVLIDCEMGTVEGM